MPRTIILVELYWTRDKDPRIPLGHASLLAALRALEDLTVVSVTRAVNAASIEPLELASEILEHALDVDPSEVDIAFGVYVWAEDLIQAILPELRRRGFAGRIVLGGPQISYAPSGVEVLYLHADVFVRGFGEAALVALATSPGRPSILGVHYRGDVDRGEQASVDLERLSSPWLSGVVPLAGQRFIRWETTRGCPFRCTFCQHREAGARLSQRELADDRIFQEIELFCRSGVDDIAVLDPIFNTGPRATRILEAFHAQSYSGRLSLQCRAEYVTDEFIEAASRLDARLEFGLQTIHAQEGRAIRRQNHMERVDAALAKVRAFGVPHEVSLIFGLPHQTLASFQESVRWCLEREVPTIKAFPLLLLRGTPLEQERERWGLQVGTGTMPMVIASDSYTFEEWMQMAALSEALQVTEGRHPAGLDGLLRLASSLTLDASRWSPRPMRVNSNEGGFARLSSS